MPPKLFQRIQRNRTHLGINLLNQVFTFGLVLLILFGFYLLGRFLPRERAWLPRERVCK